MTPPSNHPGRLAVIACFLALAAAAAHGQDLTHPWSNHDDPLVVTRNPHITGGLTWDGVRHAWTDVGIDYNWVPATRISYLIDVGLYGLQAWGFHLTNLLLHAANAALLFLALQALSGATWRSAAAGLLLAVHPIHVESVAWIAERRDVLSLFFGCLALWAYAFYIRALNHKRPPAVACGLAISSSGESDGAHRSHLKTAGLYILVVLLTCLSMLSKPTMVTLPCVMLLLDVWPLGRWAAAGAQPLRRRTQTITSIILEKLPLLAMAALSSAMTVRAQRQFIAGTDTLALSWRLVNVVRAYGAYLWMLVWPVDLLIVYAGRYLWSLPAVAATLAGLMGITYIAWRTRRDRPYLLIGWLWFLGTMIPMIGLVQVGPQIYACRYAYFPFIGLYIAVVWGLADLGVWIAGGTARPRAAAAALAIVAGAGVAGTWRQSMYWTSDLALFQPALQAGQEDGAIGLHVATALMDAGQLREARAVARHAVVVDPRNATLPRMLAQLALNDGDWDSAERLAKLSMRTGGDTAQAWRALAQARLHKGDARSAARYLGQALKLDPLIRIFPADPPAEELLAQVRAAMARPALPRRGDGGNNSP